MYYEIFPENSPQMYISNIREICENILEKISDFKNEVAILEEFKTSLSFMLGYKKTMSAKEILNKVKIILHRRKLARTDDEEN